MADEQREEQDDAERLLAPLGTPGAAPAFVVFERDAVERGVLLGDGPVPRRPR